MLYRNEAVARALRAAYIVSMGISFFTFFTHLTFDVPLLTYIVGGLLVTALGTHEFIQTERTTVMVTRFFRAVKERKDIGATLGHALFNAGILVLLLTFDVFMMLSYVTQKDTGKFPLPILESSNSTDFRR